jgi:hypothetical protein
MPAQAGTHANSGSFDVGWVAELEPRLKPLRLEEAGEVAGEAGGFGDEAALQAG